MAAPIVLITSRFRALVAIALTGWLFGSNLHQFAEARPSTWTWQFTALFPNWAAMAATIALYVYILWLGVVLTLALQRKNEKALIAAFFCHVVVGPLAALLPKFTEI